MHYMEISSPFLLFTNVNPQINITLITFVNLATYSVVNYWYYCNGDFCNIIISYALFPY